MGNQQSALGVKKLELCAVIHRADGTTEDLGVIASTDAPKSKINQLITKIGKVICQKKQKK